VHCLLGSRFGCERTAEPSQQHDFEPLQSLIITSSNEDNLPDSALKYVRP